MPRNLYRSISRLVISLAVSLLAGSFLAAADEPKQTLAAQSDPILANIDALSQLHHLGAKVIRMENLAGDFQGTQLIFSREWHGTSDDFKLLKHATDVERLSVYGVASTDDDLKQLDGLGKLSRVELFGTKVTADGAARLAKLHPGIEIDRRSDAMLGVAGTEDPAGCRIQRVEAGSAAEKAGLKVDDVIIKLQDHVITDFKNLTRQIGASQAGDRVTVELRRGDEVIKKEVTLGSWK